ncbi:MAG: S9 family peptidase [Bacteroidota bacterium]|nr:S9 family peptidase [Bacteroidota bacterium]
MRRFTVQPLLLVFVFLAGSLSAQTTAKRKLMPADIYRLQTLGDPQVAPDGQWVAYTLTSVDSALNKRNTDIWMVSWDGTQSIQMTSSPDGESQPRWSPDGKYLSFVAARDGDKYSQIWLLNRKGGEGIQLTKLKDNLVDYDWSPDGKKILLTLKTPKDTSKPKTPKPIVINRYQFKRDVEGYITEKPAIHLYVLDVATKKIDTLTTGDYQETSAAWSPDGKQIAFVSNHTEDPDRNINSDIFIMEAKPGAVPQKITSWKGSDISPEWSPDGKQLAYLRTALDSYSAYEEYYLVLQDITPGSTPKLLSKSLDRPVSNLKFSKDGSSIGVLVSDDRERYVAQFNTQTGAMTKIIGGQRSFNALQPQSADNWLVGMSEPQLPSELYAVEKGKLRRLTKHQDAFVAPLELASVEGFQSTAVDGNRVSSLLFRPAGIPATQKLPTIFYIHGGPTAQDEYSFDLTRQMFAAAGYAVVGVNYRGSSGRGLDYSTTISGDWGNKEVKDITSAVDYVIAKGIADPDKLGICGWSYGGIMTDYMIASDTRFKAASSGAGVAMVSSLYGVDQYIMQYDNELGVPWKHIDKYLSMSYPFLKADRIKTPTQFMVGQNDFNVPSPGSEQMYQALRSLGIPTELIVYPGQFHGISVPSYIKDRFDRYLAWFGKYLK